MSERQFAEALVSALGRDRLLPSDSVARLTAYWQLLAKWNAKVNLTAFPLDPPTPAAIDRLFVEPIRAAEHFPSTARAWYDLGSGGGSPAIPLKILHADIPLAMVEARERKVAFLREAARRLELTDVEVIPSRFEEVAGSRPGTADIITVRAVRPDSTFAHTVVRLLTPSGVLLSFQPGNKLFDLKGLAVIARHQLTTSGEAVLVEYVPRGTLSVDVGDD